MPRMSKWAKGPVPAAKSKVLDHQVTRRLHRPATTMLASPSRPSLHTVQRAREMLCVQARRKVPDSSSRASKGAPQKTPIKPGTTRTRPDNHWPICWYLATNVAAAPEQSPVAQAVTLAW